VLVTEQVPVALPLELLEVSALAVVLGFAEALALGFGDALALGVALAWANPTSIMELAAVAAMRVGQRTTPGRRFHIKARTPRQIRRHHRHAAPRQRSALPTPMTTMSLIFSGDAGPYWRVRQGRRLMKN
jgi:hypothetical protein